MAELTDPISGFKRKILEDPTKIKSVCLRCGAVIINSVLGGLPELEATHLEQCKKPNRKILGFPSKKPNCAS
jgi:transcription initiation factor TFIIIB Brf1 subunit/transcription initiation factor TFIIB